jgi:hypothetical protein
VFDRNCPFCLWIGNSNAAPPVQFSGCSVDYMFDFWDDSPTCLDNSMLEICSNAEKKQEICGTGGCCLVICCDAVSVKGREWTHAHAHAHKPYTAPVSAF